MNIVVGSWFNDILPVCVENIFFISDNTYLNSDYCTQFGSNWNNDSNTGTFQLNVNYDTSNSNSNLTTHLVKLRLRPCCIMQHRVEFSA